MELKKDDLDIEIKKLENKRKLFLIISICLFSIGFVLSFGPYIYMYIVGENEATESLLFLVGTIGDIMLIIAVMLLILRARLLGPKLKMLNDLKSGIPIVQHDMYGNEIIIQKKSDVVDVVPVEELSIDPKKQQLIDQYEGLLKQGLITQEDFDKKKEEILK